MMMTVRTVAAGSVVLAALAWSTMSPAALSTWNNLGYVTAAVGGGAYDVRDRTGSSVGSVAAPNPAGIARGCAIDALRNLYTVNAGTATVRKYSSQNGSLLQTISTALAAPQAVVFDAVGNFYVGFAGGAIQKYDAAGAAHGPAITGLPVDTTTTFWFDLAADQKTVFYASGGNVVRTVDLTVGASSAQVFATMTPPAAGDRAAALRLLRPRPADGPNALIGGLLLAYGRTVRQLNATGGVVMTYDASDGNQNQDDWFALALDVDDIDPVHRRFWAGDRATGKLWRFRISGAGQPDAGPFLATSSSPTIGGLCVTGEPTQGQYTRILTLSTTAPTGTATFNANTGQQHQISVTLTNLTSSVRVAVSAREVTSDGICGTDQNDVDCGFVQAFSTDLALPAGIPYVNGSAVHYVADPLRALASAEEFGVVTIESEAPHGITGLPPIALPPCTSGTTSLPRAARLLHDPTEPGLSQFYDFMEDGTLAFYIDEWGESGDFGGTSRFIAAYRCAEGFSAMTRPEPGRTFKAGQAVPVEINLTDKTGQPITTANDGTHLIVLTLGFSDQVLFTFNSPGSSYAFWNQLQPGVYRSQLQTTGLTPSPNPYFLCISDYYVPGPSTEAPLYPQVCSYFFVK